MNTWLPYVLTGTVSFIVGFSLGLLTHFLALRKDRIDRLHDFRNSIARQIEKFERTVPIDCSINTVRSLNKSGMTAWTFGRIFDGGGRKDSTLHAAFAAVWVNRHREQRCKLHNGGPLATDNKPKEMKPLCDYERGRKLILGLLTELHDLSW